MKTMMICAALLAVLAFAPKDELLGRWESISPTGNVTGVVFKPDNTFEGYINKKPFVTGTYTYKDGVFTMEDQGCAGAKGTYKMTFFSNSDSLRVELISDDCAPRAKGTNNRVFGKVKPFVVK